MKNKKLTFAYSKGGGGSWLGNLIWHLEHNDFSIDVPDNNVFDFYPKSGLYFNTSHSLEYFDLKKPTFMKFEDHTTVIKYGTNKPFQIYLNELYKIRFGICAVDQSSVFAKQFESVTVAAKAWMTDTVVLDSYCNNIDLDYELLFVNPNLFIDKLFTILDTTDMQYAKNIEYCLLSIENYKNTCPNPKNHIGNMSSIMWLGWCHALKMVHNLPVVNFNFMEATNLEQIANIFEPIQTQCLELSKPWYFLWNENE